MMNLEHFCPECLDLHEFKHRNKSEDYEIKNETVTVNAHYLECTACGELILDPENPDENYIKAYDMYRESKNLLTSSEIQDLRKKYNLSQRQMAKILGWSHVTLSRYETGAIQSQSHNNELVLLHEPENMLTILDTNKDNLNPKEYLAIRSKIEKIINATTGANFYQLVENYFSSQPSEFNGFSKFNLEKLINLLKYYLSRDSQVFKVKLMKYLWYTDFIHFKNYTVSMTGLSYIRIKMGPVPNEYDMLISLILNEERDIGREYIDFPKGQGELFSSNEDFDSSLFTDDELETMKKVYDLVSPHNSSSISKLSHKEKAWLETENRNFISYMFANELSVN